ncbi:MAG: hypothetical protein A2087_00015 [Spirochaetes bacterium GWD1_61_31]|nr:MAG: hypothetical protein A2Y37_00025 [Spirochaetes bacterium GWB1_60_80]OHD30733.1 MAG: hypothetical protein A2004_07160 [Spirochaetes bacterium GWC1_61_12]OHD41357.1 MAG: hypothetical protein A2087_00015 [Spirochaetes bacterium GWD1_61_31]OHD42687.1 MAG: hypothetical protein A2Y35_12270 [Spirochaetes bacterium GWE1_60_18]OHD58567.1 MAG: hypothetical protein A2Y32_08850 [Spirochaetes bacterium GWF1_60_12]
MACLAWLGLFLLASCQTSSLPAIDYRAEMRAFVVKIAETARASQAAFIVIPQNGLELLSAATAPAAVAAYLAAIDGVAREDLHFGYPGDGDATAATITADWLGQIDQAQAAGLVPLAIDYVTSNAQADAALSAAAAEGVIGFATFRRALDDLPEWPVSPPGNNPDDMASLGQIRNFGYLINPGNFADKAAYLAELADSRYDLLVIDLFGVDGNALSAAEVEALQRKPQGGRRLVIAYLSIGEAEEYRWYWRPDWDKLPPGWLERENPAWAGNYKVHYWEPAWQSIICGGEGSYLDRIIDAGFDGVYLDIIDAFEYFEGST